MRYDLQSIHQMVSADPTMKFLYFWGHTPSAKGITQTCLSQWFDVAFEIDGVKYHTAEQYMMAQKAPLFKDCLTLENVVLPKSFCDIIK